MHILHVKHVIEHHFAVRLASWPSDKAFVSGARDLKFKSPVKLDTIIANGSPPLRHFFERSCVARAQRHGDVSRKLVPHFGVIQGVLLGLDIIDLILI